MNIALQCLATIVIFSDLAWRHSALRLARQLETPSVCVLHIDLPHNASVAWGSSDYFARIRQRIPVLRRLMAERIDGRGWLGLFDADVVALRNVSARIDRLFRDAAHVDMVAQQEWPCASAPLRPCINGGVWAVRRSPRGLALLERAEYLIERLRIPDQDALDIATHNTSVLYLDRRRYANGATALVDPSWRAHGAHLVHANWLPSVACKLAWLDYFWHTRFHSRPASKYEGTAGAMRRRCGVSLRSTI